MSEEREYSPKRFAIASVVCPACETKLDREAKWCDSCGFTGAKSLDLFGENPPPLLPILDVADFWNAKQQKRIEAAISSLKKRFPQINWRICAVSLDQTISLPLFGFWLMNVCPLLPEESEEDREWTVLLLIDAESGRASVTTGYGAEVWLSPEMWEKALMETRDPFLRGQNDKGVVDFLGVVRTLLEMAWKRSQKQIK